MKEQSINKHDFDQGVRLLVEIQTSCGPIGVRSSRLGLDSGLAMASLRLLARRGTRRHLLRPDQRRVWAQILMNWIHL